MRNLSSSQVLGFFKNADFWLHFLLFGIFISLAFHEAWNSLFNILFILTAFFTGSWGKLWQRFKENPILLGLASLYLVYLIGAFYSSHQVQAWNKVQVKTMLWLLPLAFLLVQNRLKSLLFRRFAVLTVVAIAIACLIRAFSRYWGTGDFAGNDSVFYYYRLSAWIMHPNYMMLFFGGVFVIFAESFVAKRRVFSKRWDILLFTFLMTFAALFLQARTGLFIITAIILAYTALWSGQWWRKKFVIRKALVTTLVASFIWLGMPQSMKKRYYVDTSTEYVADDEKDTSVSGRLVIWEHCWACILEKPLFGYGTGDGVPRLHQRFYEAQFEKGMEDLYNCHNQFLDTYMAVGLPGLLALALIFFFALRIFFKRDRNVLPLLFLAFYYASMSVESLLDRHKGVMAFTLFIFYFAVLSKNHVAQSRLD